MFFVGFFYSMAWKVFLGIALIGAQDKLKTDLSFSVHWIIYWVFLIDRRKKALTKKIILELVDCTYMSEPMFHLVLKKCKIVILIFVKENHKTCWKIFLNECKYEHNFILMFSNLYVQCISWLE